MCLFASSIRLHLSFPPGLPYRVYEFLDFVLKRLCNTVDVKAHDLAFSGSMQILVENKRNLLLHILNVLSLMRLKCESQKLDNRSSLSILSKD